MADKFADLEPSKWRNVFPILAVVLVVGAFLLFRWSGSAPVQVSGVVESAGAVSVAKISGGTRERATVRLTNGAVVFAFVASGGPLSPGDRVTLLEERRLLGGPVYQIVAQDHGLEP
jgi:hypothetical protein